MSQALLHHKKDKSMNKSRDDDVTYDEADMQQIKREEARAIELKKSRLQRLHHNNERIAMIKHVYEREPRKKLKIHSDI